MKPSELALRVEVEAGLYEAACECTNALRSRNAYDEEVAALRQTLLDLVELGVRLALSRAAIEAHAYSNGAAGAIRHLTPADILQAPPGAEEPAR